MLALRARQNRYSGIPQLDRQQAHAYRSSGNLDACLFWYQLCRPCATGLRLLAVGWGRHFDFSSSAKWHKLDSVVQQHDWLNRAVYGE